MAKQRNAFVAGLFIIVCIVVAFAIVIGIKGLDTFVNPKDTRTVTFTLQDDLSGLNVGDDVRVGGFKVGEVRKIEIVPSDDPRIARRVADATRPARADDQVLLVSFSIPKKYPFHEGARVGIQSTVTGQSCLNIDSLGQRSKPELNTQVALVGRPSAFSSLLNTIDEIKPKVAGIVAQVSDVTVPQINGIVAAVNTRTIPSVNASLQQIEKTTIPTVNGALADTRQDIGEILFNVKTNTIPGVNSTLASFHGTADHATQLVDEVRSYVKPVADKVVSVGDSARGMMDQINDVFAESKTDLRGTLANLNAATAGVKQTLPQILDEVKMAMATIRGIVQENRPQVSGAVTAVHETADTMKHAMAELRRAPWRLIWRPNPDDEKNLTLFETARQFAEGAADLKAAADQLQLQLNDKNVDKKNVQAMLQKVQRSFENFQGVEKRLWEQVKE